MLRKNDRQHIISKIEVLQSALFFSDSPERVITSAVLQQLYTDDQQQVWFTVPKPAYTIDPNQLSFPCRMDFYKKAATFHIKISGLATIMSGPVINDCRLPLAAIINDDEKKNYLIICVKIEQADCFERTPLPSDGSHNKKTSLVIQALNKITVHLFSKTLHTDQLVPA